MSSEQPAPLTYAAAGVNLAARHSLVDRYREVAKAAGSPQVLGGIGPFAGLFHLAGKLRDPVIVASTDSVGTKVKLAALIESYESLGHDIVNHCVNDAFTTGAEPLFFLDYIGSAGLSDDAKVALVRGAVAACAAAGCALLGGETADMPGVYASGDFDLVGFVVGAVERDKVIDGTKIEAGDLLFGLPSTGLHTNGYSLARRALGIGLLPGSSLADTARLERYEPGLGETLAEALLRPHHSYLRELQPALGVIKGMAHITGGGFEENVPRMLLPGLGARLKRDAWPVLPVFNLIQSEGGIDVEEMYRVFNMGLGMVFAVAPPNAARLRELVPGALAVGEVIAVHDGPRVVWG